MRLLFIKILNKLGLLSKVNISGKLILNAQKFRIPIIKSNGYNNLFMSEIWMIELLNHILKDKATNEKKFIDIGVNIGQTLLKLRSVSPNMKYVGFEPNPLCIFYTNELIKANSDIKNSDISIYPVGISTENEVLALNLFSENEMDSSASIIEEFRDDEIKQKINIPVFNIDTISKGNNELKNIGIIKIDVEGAELEVLTSLKTLITKERPFILIEILPVYSNDNEFRISRQKNIETLFKELNYNIYRIERDSQSSFSGLKKINIIEIHSDLNLCDYIMIPNENTNLNELINNLV